MKKRFEESSTIRPKVHNKQLNMPDEALRKLNIDKIEKKRSLALLDFSNDLVQLNKQILEKHFYSQNRLKHIVPPQSCPNRTENKNINSGYQMYKRRFKKSRDENTYGMFASHD
jgi:hypothetical protein